MAWNIGSSQNNGWNIGSSQDALSAITPTSATFELDTGSYVGNDSNPRTITISVGGTPDAVMVKANSATTEWQLRTEDMLSNQSLALTNSTSTLSGITSIGDNEFTINNELNVAGVTYYYIAFRDDYQYDFRVGTYTGSGSPQTISTGFATNCAIVCGESSDGIFGSSAFPISAGHLLNGDDYFATECFAFNSDGFDIGNNSAINTASDAYYYLAFNSDIADVGTYVGDETDRTISATSANPLEFVLTVGTSSVPWYRFGSDNPDSFKLTDALASSGITNLSVSSFDIGNDNDINKNTETYYWMSLRSGIIGEDEVTFIPIVIFID